MLENKCSLFENDRLIRAIYREKIDRTPVWIMRQAGRYLPEYRALRREAKDFLNFCKTPELAFEATMQPLARYPLDAAILFSDILTIPDAYGLGLNFIEGQGPCFKNPIRSQEAVSSLPHLDPNRDLAYVMQTIRLIKSSRNLKVPLIGFAGSPWTLACYMIEGQASKNFNEVKRFLYQEPQLLHQLLAHLSQSIIDYLRAQIEAGADVLMLFDSWGGLLSPPHYQEFSLNYMKKIIQAIKTVTPSSNSALKTSLKPVLNSALNSSLNSSSNFSLHNSSPLSLPDSSNLLKTNKGSGENSENDETPVILFSKNGGILLEEISQSACDVIGLDWTADLKQARQRVGKSVALQGNLDPAALYAKPSLLKEHVKQVLDNFGYGSGHIFNLGHGISPDVHPDQVSVMIEAIHKLSPAYHY